MKEKDAIVGLLRQELGIIESGNWSASDKPRFERIIQRIEDNLVVNPDLIETVDEGEYRGPTNNKEAYGDGYTGQDDNE
jgi:hypothetical protein